jgi:SAM-dependent methyltransferase
LTKRESSIVDLAGTAVAEIESHLGAMEMNFSLYQEENFDERIEEIDFIEFHLLDSIDDLLQKATQPHQLDLLKYRAQKLKTYLEEIDAKLFKKLRAKIQTGAYRGAAFRNLVSEYVDFNLDDIQHQEDAGYDNLDLFINVLTPCRAIPGQTKELEPEMVYYQKTPARIIFELAERCAFKKEDVFFDLGSGLGQVSILVSLLTGVAVKGIEFEPAFCNYAKDCAAELNLSNITFINIDARNADYAEGSVFFMFTPFKGEMMQEVLEALRKQALQRRITVITYGPCTTQVALQNWLDCVSPNNNNVYKLSVFCSGG